MGIVARQSFKAGIVTYLGVLMGVLNNLLIYPYMLSVKQYGEVQFILQTATFFTPFLMMGLAAVLTRYYPKYKDDPVKKQGFYGLVFAIVSFNVLIFLGLFLLFKDHVTAYYLQKSGVAVNSIYVLVAISMLLPFQGLARSYSANQGADRRTGLVQPAAQVRASHPCTGLPPRLYRVHLDGALIGYLPFGIDPVLHCVYVQTGSLPTAFRLGPIAS